MESRQDIMLKIPRSLHAINSKMTFEHHIRGTLHQNNILRNRLTPDIYLRE
jgi:hypothetical protein